MIETLKPSHLGPLPKAIQYTELYMMVANHLLERDLPMFPDELASKVAELSRALQEQLGKEVESIYLDSEIYEGEGK